MMSSILDRLMLTSRGGRMLNLELVRKPKEKYDLKVQNWKQTDTGSTGLNGLVQKWYEKIKNRILEKPIFMGAHQWNN